METPPPTAPIDPRSAFLEEKAFKSRTVLIFGTITDGMAAEAARRLIALDADSGEPIDVIVSSPGGHLESVHSLPGADDRQRLGGQRRDPRLLSGASRASLLPAEHPIPDPPAERRY